MSRRQDIDAVMAVLTEDGLRPGRRKRIRESIECWLTMPAFIVVIDGLPLRAATKDDVERMCAEFFTSGCTLVRIINVAAELGQQEVAA